MQPNKHSTSITTPTGVYEIATDTAIVEGQAVTLTNGKITAQAVDGTGAILGAAAQSHSGSSSSYHPSDYSLGISVYDDPNQIFEMAPVEVTATSGTTTTIVSTSAFVAESGSDTLVDDDFIGGYAKLIEKDDASTNTDEVGTIYAISDSDAGDKSLTIAEAGGAVTAGDVFYLFPPIGFAKGNLNTARTDIVLTASAAIPFKVVGHDLKRNKVLVKAKLHILGNKNS